MLYVDNQFAGAATVDATGSWSFSNNASWAAEATLCAPIWSTRTPRFWRVPRWSSTGYRPGHGACRGRCQDGGLLCGAGGAEAGSGQASVGRVGGLHRRPAEVQCCDRESAAIRSGRSPSAIMATARNIPRSSRTTAIRSAIRTGSIRLSVSRCRNKQAASRQSRPQVMRQAWQK